MAIEGHAGLPSLFSDPKTKALANIIAQYSGKNIKNILVVGCGSGIEAAFLAQELHTAVVGIDVSPAFDPLAAATVELQQGDATRLRFPDASFDCVYSYHALEHIPKYRTALQEMSRVLRRQGIFCIGTPNRLRLIGYLGSKRATMQKKFLWNLADWKARMQGKFRNEFGAHAGYSAKELRAELEKVFKHVEEISSPYYQAIYPKHARALQWIGDSCAARFIFPSVYFIGRK